ncbi:MAG: PucR family transcriptional regulator ligand-binding domain-containing protein [Anaerolineae bacterium]
MLTVADVLKLEQLKSAKIVAGQRGLDKPIAWVHIASVPDAPRWLRGGELVLTTGHNIPKQPSDQRQYIQDMADKGVAGLVLSIGRYIDHVPDDLRKLAEQNDFPLIEISYEQPFIDIAKAANERIAEENMAMVTGALDIQQRLTQLVLDGGDLKQLASRMAGLLGQSISIENERFEILASANVAAVDEARRFTVSEGRTDPRLLAALEERGILPEIRQTLRPVHIPQMADVGLELERILAPIVVHGDIYGYVWIIADDRPLTELDSIAINIGATVAALMMLYQESVQSAEASLKGSLLSQLIQSEGGREAVLTDQALRYGVDLTGKYVMLLLESDERNTQRMLQLYRRVNRLAGMHDWRAVVGQFAGEVLILTQADQPVRHMIEQIQREVNGGLSFRVGVSGVLHGAEAVSKAHQQCREVLHISRRLKDEREAVYFDDLGYLHALYRAGKDSIDTNPFVPVVRRLLEAGESDLFDTLEGYLDAGGNGVQTAEMLHIHRSTLNYRLDRLKELCGVDLGDAVTRTNLQVALKLLRLFGVE